MKAILLAAFSMLFPVLSARRAPSCDIKNLAPMTDAEYSALMA